MLCNNDFCFWLMLHWSEWIYSTSRDGAFGPVYFLVVCDLSLIQTFEIQTAATEIVKMPSIFKIKLLKMIGHASKDLSAIVYIWTFTTNSDRKSTKWWAIWFRSRLFGFVCHKSLIGHIRHQWPCHISRNFNKVFSWETTWTSENPKNSSMQNCFEEVRPEVLSSCLSTRRSSFSNIFCFLEYA